MRNGVFDYSAFESSQFALERDVYHPDFMYRRGWELFRVWSRDWWLNKTKVLQMIVKKIQKIEKAELEKKQSKNVKNEKSEKVDKAENLAKNQQKAEKNEKKSSKNDKNDTFFDIEIVEEPERKPNKK